MKTKILACWIIMLAVTSTTWGEEILLQDDFAGKLADGWTWIREDPTGWRVKDHGLEVRVQPGNMWGGANNAKNVLVRSVPEPTNGPIIISVAVENRPTAQYEQVDLVWYYDDSHMVKIGQELVDKKLSIVMGREEKDRTRTIAIIPLSSDSVRLRFIADGIKLRGQFRTPNAEWQTAGECDMPANGAPKVSLQCYQGPKDTERWARIREFRITRPDK